MHKLLLLTLSAALSIGAAVAQAQASEQPAVTHSALAGPLHLLQGKGGNVLASIGDDGILIVDDDYADYAQAYEDTLQRLAAKDEAAPRFVLNTHWHSDHTGSNQYWGERGAVIVAHDNVYRRLSTRQDMKAMGGIVEPSPRAALPLVTYADSMALRFNGGTLEVQHYPRGHTDGDSVVYFLEQNVVHMGDHFFKDRFPFVDLVSGGSVAGYLSNVKAVLERIDAATIVVPGHGSVANKEDLQRFVDMLEATTAQVQLRLSEGEMLDDILNSGLGEQWQSWGSGFINEANWIRTVAADFGE